MAALKVGINGFGRIGRLVLRAGIKNPNIEFVGINDLVPPDNLAYLLKHDSTHGLYKGTVEAKADGIVVDGKFVPCVSVRNPAELPWGKSGADYVRVATNVKKDDGSRAIGTVLDPKGKAIVYINRNEAFFGEVMILGKPYIAGYEPMHDAANNVIGVYYVGYMRE